MPNLIIHHSLAEMVSPDLLMSALIAVHNNDEDWTIPHGHPVDWFILIKLENGDFRLEFSEEPEDP